MKKEKFFEIFGTGEKFRSDKLDLPVMYPFYDANEVLLSEDFMGNRFELISQLRESDLFGLRGYGVLMPEGYGVLYEWWGFKGKYKSLPSRFEPDDITEHRLNILDGLGSEDENSHNYLWLNLGLRPAKLKKLGFWGFKVDKEIKYYEGLLYACANGKMWKKKRIRLRFDADKTDSNLVLMMPYWVKKGVLGKLVQKYIPYDCELAEKAKCLAFDREYRQIVLKNGAALVVNVLGIIPRVVIYTYEGGKFILGFIAQKIWEWFKKLLNIKRAKKNFLS